VPALQRHTEGATGDAWVWRGFAISASNRAAAMGQTSFDVKEITAPTHLRIPSDHWFAVGRRKRIRYVRKVCSKAFSLAELWAMRTEGTSAIARCSATGRRLPAPLHCFTDTASYDGRVSKS
jgi:hypothetical protein